MNSQIKHLICFNSLAIIFTDIQTVPFTANGIYSEWLLGCFDTAPTVFGWSTAF